MALCFLCELHPGGTVNVGSFEATVTHTKYVYLAWLDSSFRVFLCVSLSVTHILRMWGFVCLFLSLFGFGFGFDLVGFGYAEKSRSSFPFSCLFDANFVALHC